MVWKFYAERTVGFNTNSSYASELIISAASQCFRHDGAIIVSNIFAVAVFEACKIEGNIYLEYGQRYIIRLVEIMNFLGSRKHKHRFVSRTSHFKSLIF